MSATDQREQTIRVIAFTIYSVIFESVIWGIFGWAVFVKGYSGWWMLLAMFTSCAQLKPSAFGIR